MKKEIEQVGKHGDDSTKNPFSIGAGQYISAKQAGFETFSIGIFQWIPCRNGKHAKPGKVRIRVKGRINNFVEIRKKANEIIEALDAGDYDGPTNVIVK